ncbi:MAG: EamA family transporter RarD [Micrococcales bacterium]
MKNPEHNYARGFLFGLTAYIIWGAFPIIIGLLGFASAFEIISWRIIFGFVTGLVLLLLTKNLKSIVDVFRDRRALTWVIASAVLIFINWSIYVIAVSSHQVVEASLGYFINPLITILLAVVFMKEKLPPTQWVAVGFGAVAVLVLSFDYGRLPWIALSLALSFGVYGLAKSKVAAKALTSFTIESGLVTPLAIVQLILVDTIGSGLMFASQGFIGSTGLVMYGFMTAIPLILFGTAAQLVPLRFIGFMQYISPILQFLVGILYFHEPMPAARWFGFVLVWCGLAVLIFDAIRGTRNHIVTKRESQ